ncbi:hypothetical protein ORM77_25450 [Bacillus cereus]|uniref:hypothetical protein n=1 Tax=Bacillus cereus TaxID=1396 RepID=UPI002AC2DC73|nr:hypothetical protein [Bacillus cereus]MDZ4621195.1 hypothetical protein [Bacillus cereus]
MFLLFLWKDDINKELKKQLELQFVEKFPYSLLSKKGEAKLFRATAPIACIAIGLVYGYKARFLNEKKEKEALAGRNYKEVRADSKSDFPDDFRKTGRLMNEHAMLPDNKNIKRELDRIVSKE